MTEADAAAIPSTTPAAAAQAGSREIGQQGDGIAAAPVTGDLDEGRTYVVGAGVTRAVEGRPYERRPGDPLYRPLRIFALDPTALQLEGAVAQVNVPYEPLEPAFKGRVLEVDPRDGATGQEYRSLDLNQLKLLLEDGRAPSPSDPLFHQQMVYAVASLVYASFKAALGRHLAWGFTPRTAGEPTRLLLRPYAFEGENAYYEPDNGALCFGYYRARSRVTGRNVPGGLVFTSLSHDIVAHEVTHALLDGLRAYFATPTGPDVRAFHEGFADLVAIFQHFSYEQVVQSALARAKGRLAEATLLTDLAGQFGQTIGEGQALRSAIDPPGALGSRRHYDEHLDEHALGSVLVSAVFDAFVTVFTRKTARYFRLATGGTGVVPPGEIPEELRTLLAEKASTLAAQFLSVCVRAIDYCPPVDIELGEYLRAVITADRDLVPHDRWAYREAWIDAFRGRDIYAPGVGFLSEDALLWEPPRKPLPRLTELTFGALKFDGDPACPADAEELRRQARALGRLVSRPVYLDTFGLARASDPRLGGDTVELPRVESIRSSRRVGPDGQVVFDLVAEVTQTRHVRSREGAPGFDFVGGATIIIGPDGDVRYVISKSVLNDRRLARQRDFILAERGRRLWERRGDRLVPKAQLFKLLHERADVSASG